jgi:hypothetical protein
MLEVQHTPTGEVNISYVDDTSLLQFSISIDCAIRRLREYTEYQISRGKYLILTFSPSKFNLLHCLLGTSKDKTNDLATHPPLTINGNTIPPSQSIKYRGTHIEESRTFKIHATTAALLRKSILALLLFHRHCRNGIPV